MKLGSLFDGSGGFPLAGTLHGVTPVWASEIEKYPIAVTTARFPNMKHLGDVTKIDGAAVEPVDIITFGSPCQDLSVAGKQAGLHKGERSNLFFEAIRIIKEMRRSTDGIYPRIAVWENVPGAYSSNKGKDFQSVLKAFCTVKDETADVPRPAAGKWNPAGTIVGNGWSIAWRTFDAQYWGVPQRRKRIYLIADFGSERAGEILFEQEGSSRNTPESGTAGEGIAGDAEGSVGGSSVWAIDHVITTGGNCTAQGPCVYENIAPTEKAAGVHAVCYPIDLISESRGAFETYEQDADKAGSLKQCDNKGSHVVCYSLDRASFNQGINAKYDICIEPELNSPLVARGPSAVCYDARGNGDGETSCTITGDHQNRVTDYTAVAVQEAICGVTSGVQFTGDFDTTAKTLRARDFKEPQAVVVKINRRYIIRRLTPLETCRLQGFPDWWEDGVQGSDSARYKMWGNGIALPNAEYAIGCAVELINERR